MRDILTTTAAEAARATRFVQRTSPLGGATFRQTLAFGFLANPQASLEELAQTAAALGVSLTPQALDQRFTAAAASCLEQVRKAAITQVIAGGPWQAGDCGAHTPLDGTGVDRAGLHRLRR